MDMVVVKQNQLWSSPIHRLNSTGTGTIHKCLLKGDFNCQKIKLRMVDRGFFNLEMFEQNIHSVFVC